MNIPPRSLRVLVSTALLVASATYCFLNLPVQKKRMTWLGEQYVVSEGPYYGNKHNFGTTGFNANGDLSGYGLSSSGRYTARLFSKGVDRELETLKGYDGSSSYDLNTKLQAVGITYKNFSTYSDRPTIGTFWEAGKAFALPPLKGFPNSRAWAINEAGTCVGLSYGPNTASRNARSMPTVWVHLKPKALPLPSGAIEGETRNINQAGEIIGTVTLKDGKTRACSWINNLPTVLPSITQSDSCRGVSINNWGVIAGRSGQLGFIWDRGIMTPLVYPGAPKIIPITVNDLGWILVNDQGDSVNAELNDDPCLPLLFRPGKGFVRVAHLLPSGSKYMMIKAMGLNEKGQIALGALVSGGKSKLIVLSPPVRATDVPIRG